MKLFVNILKILAIAIWFAMAVFVTVCLLSYNEYGIPVIGKNSYIIIDSDELEPDFRENDLVIVRRDSDRDINIGDMVFFISGNRTYEAIVNIGEITAKETISNREVQFQIEGTEVLGEDIIGRSEGLTGIRYLGRILAFLTSRWGYLFAVVLPTLFFLVYEVMLIIEELRKLKREAQ